MTVIGLTGGIASGKSTAAGWMKDYGAIVIDADRLGHRVYEPGSSGFEAVVNEFGHNLVGADGQINRQLLGGKVFGDPDQMKRLTDIVWPEIRRLAKQEVADLKRRDKKAIIVLEAAVLIEAKWFDLVDEVWVVTVDPGTARERLMIRNNMNADQAQSRIDAQISNKERQQYGYVKIDNSGILDEFHEKVTREWKRLVRRAAQGTPAPKTAATLAATKAASRSAVPARAASSLRLPVPKPSLKAAKAMPAPGARPAPPKPVGSGATASNVTVSRTPVAPVKATPVQPAVATKAAPVKAPPAKAAVPAKASAPKAAPAKAAATKPAVKAPAKSAAKAAAKPAARATVSRVAAPKAAARPAARTTTATRRSAR